MTINGDLSKEEIKQTHHNCYRLSNRKYIDASCILEELAGDQGSLKYTEIRDKMIEMGKLAEEAKRLDDILSLIV